MPDMESADATDAKAPAQIITAKPRFIDLFIHFLLFRVRASGTCP